VRIRQQLLPALAAEDPRVREHLADLADEARALSAWLEAEAARALALAADGHQLRVGALEALAPPLRRATLRAWLEAGTGRPLSRAHLVAVEGSRSEREEVRLARGFDVSLRGGTLILRHRAKRSGRGERPTG